MLIVHSSIRAAQANKLTGAEQPQRRACGQTDDRNSPQFLTSHPFTSQGALIQKGPHQLVRAFALPTARSLTAHSLQRVVGLLAAGTGVAGRGLRLATGGGGASARLFALYLIEALFTGKEPGLLSTPLSKKWVSQIPFWDFKINIYFISLFFHFFKERYNKNIY
ncbi:hypothetical protein [Aeromonas veronii]|uniref:hypothetical protein n=1 Tax=Aeromonas veronii TaxID=654 RepID=UPI00197B4774|nr:hypothetical protein [Aeromonas veronii]